MADGEQLTPEQEYCEAKGAHAVLNILREEMEQWADEAEDNSKKEELDNVLSHIEAMEEEYKGRVDDLARQLGLTSSGNPG